MNINIDYKETIINAVNNGVDCLELHKITAIFKAKGLSQSDAYNILVEARAMFANENETKEDLILELMDFVVGYCQDRFLIWDSSELNTYSKVVKFSVHDFIDTQRSFTINNFENYKVFDVNKNCIIFNKMIAILEVEMQVHEDVSLAECISVFNKCLEWLNSDTCKNNLIEKFCEFINSYSEKTIAVEEIISNKWHEKLEVRSVIITVPPDYTNMNFCVICIDKWHSLYVNIKENIITSISEIFENGKGYDGIWTK